ncbi:MAG TPA: hypothetical protein DDZ78_03060, partial [Porphyromonadaceae bacterium]|nr:hypothetical protein [Porphyromonadaceae bacterium]
GIQSISPAIKVEKDIDKLKEAMRRGVTWYDSASKAGSENELLLWVQLKKDSKIVLPNFTNLIKMQDEKQDGKVVYDFNNVTEILDRNSDQIEKIELYYNKVNTKVFNLPKNVLENNL